MIFWILIAAVGLAIGIAAVIGWTDVPWQGWQNKLADALRYAAFTGLVASVAAVVLFVMVVPFSYIAPMNLTETNRVDLRALGTGQDIDGRSYFLGSGYIDQEQVFTYIEQRGEEYRLKQADADDSVVLMDEQESPYVEVHEWEADLWWFAPFMSNTAYTYSFHIPEGSITDSYVVTP